MSIDRSQLTEKAYKREITEYVIEERNKSYLQGILAGTAASLLGIVIAFSLCCNNPEPQRVYGSNDSYRVFLVDTNGVPHTYLVEFKDTLEQTK